MSSRTRSALASWVLLLPCTLLMGCKQEPYGNQPIRQRGVGPPIELHPAAQTEPPKPFSPQLLPLRVDETPRADEAAPSDDTLPAGEAVPQAADKPARNLQHELEDMIGSPSDCMAAQKPDAAPSEVRLSLTASVMPSGAVGRAEVSASTQLGKQELDCVRTKLEALHFATPIENAPIQVSGSITMKYGS
jgi:hypothetical protein